MHMSREAFVGMRLEVVGRGMHLDMDIRYPLHTACPDVAWHHDPQREAVQEWQRLIIHLIGQQCLGAHGFLDGDRAAKAKWLTPSLNLIKTEKNHMPSPGHYASREQDLS